MRNGTISRCLHALALAVAACGLFTGCATQSSRAMDCRVTVAPSLGTRIWVTDVRLSKIGSDQYTMSANVVNSANAISRLEYKVVWLDASGMEVPSAVSTWQPHSLAPLEIGRLNATAPGPDAVDFMFYVKEAR